MVRKDCGRAGYGGRFVDLRVEDHPNPIAELQRLLNLHRVYWLIDESEDKLTKGKFEEALSTIREAVSLNPNVDDAHVDLGIISLKMGKKAEAVKAFREALRLNPKIKSLIKQLPKAGLMEPNAEIFRELGI